MPGIKITVNGGSPDQNTSISKMILDDFLGRIKQASSSLTPSELQQLTINIVGTGLDISVEVSGPESIAEKFDAAMT